jgi:uncharacterized protein YndB with AHSA1/START domain
MRVDRATRHIAAAPETVFRAFVDPRLLERWLAPEDMTARLEQFDADRGYTMVLTYDHPPAGGGKATADSDVSVVRRTLVDPPRRIVEEVEFPSDVPAFSGTMTLTWSLEPEPEGTLVTVEATDVPRGIPQDVHVGALVGALAQLARIVV